MTYWTALWMALTAVSTFVLCVTAVCAAVFAGRQLRGTLLQVRMGIYLSPGNSLYEANQRYLSAKSSAEAYLHAERYVNLLEDACSLVNNKTVTGEVAGKFNERIEVFLDHELKITPVLLRVLSHRYHEYGSYKCLAKRYQKRFGKPLPTPPPKNTPG